ncbi:MAG: 50S ribosomal protein L24e [Nanoarchaeota archaeon]|nr:50S ribosomal protein L24e [Thermodesulfovibrionia bacterium]MCK5282401.1 50S ribosomal protein L24e [Nanoarchaeota archaeon]
MVKMVKCTFCGRVIEQGTGKIYVLKEGKALDFCSLKCEKNMLKLKRKAITTKWSSKYIKHGN